MTLSTSIATTLVHLTTDDGAPIEGLFYDAAGEQRIGLLHVHGKGGNMFRCQSRFLPELLPGYVHLSINMRCHDLATYTNDPKRPMGGGMYEVLADGHYDLHAGVRYLREVAKVDTVIVTGHSSGGWYLGDYTNHYDDIDGRVMLSPLTDNKTRLTSWWFAGDPEGLAAFRAEAEALVAAGRSDQLLLAPGDYWAIAADTLVERASEIDDHWLRSVQANHTPILQFFGSLETDRDKLWPVLFEKFDAAVKRDGIIEGADHSFDGFEHPVAEMVADFVTEVTGVDGRPRA